MSHTIHYPGSLYKLMSSGSFSIFQISSDISSSSSHDNNKKNNILVLDKEFVQEINGTTIYAEKLYKINFTEKK